LEKYLEKIRLLKKYDIVVFASFIIGFPGETHETFQDTVQLLKEAAVDFYRAQVWYCEPITPIWKEKEKYKIEGKSFEWTHDTMDSKTASQLRENMFLSIDDSVYVPQYNFDFDNIFHLIHRGMTLEQVKNFLYYFNKGVKEKILEPTSPEVGLPILEQLIKSHPHIAGNRCPGNTIDRHSKERRSQLEIELDF
jgi:radical SAM superfamily enzyme YgiQ (UPF0313 family)